MPERSDTLTLAVIASAVVVADQLSKAAVIEAIGPGQPSQRIDIAGQWLSLEYAENRGIAFGVLANAGGLAGVAAFLVLVALLLHYVRMSTPPIWETLAIGAIAGGAIGNLIDRVRLGFVVDFVSIGAWPNFNVADSAITAGAILLICGWFLSEQERAAIHTS